MEPTRYQRIKEIFAAARTLRGAGRDAYLDDSCGADQELRREVEELLLSESQVEGSALGRILSDELPTEPAPSIPNRIAGYRVLGVCGHGGMGTVYEAEQESPRRRVALKVIQSGSDRPETRSRFRREAEILGRLQHPGIGQIFEAGEFEQDGLTRPFIALEFVEGLPLLAHARRHELSIDERIELFSRVCEAVEYAHEQGVVHRDLKPENILVSEGSTLGATTSGGGLPKVLDFGVARLVDMDLMTTLSTSAGQLLGSVPYMSPEQADGQPELIDRRSDVYSLGVILFELLSDRLPHDLRDCPLAEALDRIRRTEPRPLGDLDSQLRGDLQTIVGKCLEKDPQRRYPSVKALALDLQRHREHEPIHARPPSTIYQLAKLVRRHRGLAAGIVLAMLSLSIGMAVAIGFAVEASRSEQETANSLAVARREAYRANLSAASAHLEDDPRAARQALDDVPERMRSWEWHYLDSSLSAVIAEFGRLAFEQPLKAAVELIVVDGESMIATAPDRERVEYHDSSTGELLATITAPEPVHCWGIAQDGRRVAAGYEDGRVLVYDREGSKQWELWLQRDEPIGALLFQPKGEQLAVTTLSQLSVGTPTRWVEVPMRARRSEAPLISFSRDGSRLAMYGGKTNPNYRVWNSGTMELLVERPVHLSTSSLALDTEGKRIVFGEYYSKVMVVDVASGEELITLLGHEHQVNHVAIRGERVLSTSNDHSMRVWNLESGEQQRVFSEPTVRRAEFLGSDRLISGSPARLCLRSLESRRGRVLAGHKSYVYDVAFNRSGDILASYVLHGSELSFWNPTNGELLGRMGALGAGSRMGFEANGETLWIQAITDTWRAPWMLGRQGAERVSSSPSIALTWDMRSKTFGLRQAQVTPLIPPAGLSTWRVHFARQTDATQGPLELVSGSLNGAPLELTRTPLPPEPFAIGAHPRLYLGSFGDYNTHFDGSIAELILFDGELTADETREVEAYLSRRRSTASDSKPEHPPTPRGAKLLAHFRADRGSLELDPENNAVLRWSSRAGPELTLERQGNYPTLIKFVESKGTSSPAVVRFTSSQRFTHWLEAPLQAMVEAKSLTAFVLGEFKGSSSSSIFSIDTLGRGDLGIRDPNARVVSPGRCFSADGSLVVVGGLYRGMPLLLRNASSGEVLLKLEGEYFGVALSPDGERLVAGTADGQVELWDVTEQELLASMHGHASQVYAIAFHPDGSRVVTSGNDRIIVIRDPETLAPLLELREHDMYVKSLAFSPDGRMLASASGDGTVRLWDTASKTERHLQSLEASALESEVREEALTLRRSFPDPGELLAAIRERWSEHPGHRSAAHRVLAKTNAD